MDSGEEVVITAALATFPARLPTLEKVLQRLRPQVDRLCVYLDKYDYVPDVVKQYADEAISGNQGDAGKFHWADAQDGYYLTCDDDLVYDEHYVAWMIENVQHWGGRAIVTAHGRIYEGAPHDFLSDNRDGTQHDFSRSVGDGAWINWPGTGCMAADLSVRTLPVHNLVPNACDNVLALWGQIFHIPFWWPARQRQMIEDMVLNPSIWKAALDDGCKQMNMALEEWQSWRTWPLTP